MRVPRRNESLCIKIANNEQKEVDYFKYLGSVLTRDDYCTRKIKTKTVMAKEALTEIYHS